MNTTEALSRTEEQEDRRRWLALYVLCTGFLMIVLDMTVVNVALPYIQQDLDFSTASLAWVVNAYLIAFGGVLLLAGRLGDLLGRRNVFFVGLALFTVASFLCGLSQSQAMLVGARFLQGVGGALTSAVILGMIVTMFTKPQEQAKAFGIYAFVASSGGAIGLLVGGFLTQAINWHWIFFVNIPIAVVTAVFALRLIDRDEGLGWAEGADVPGSLLITGGLMLTVFTIVKPAAEDGWLAPNTLILGAISLALLTGFVARQAMIEKPLMPLRIFKHRNVSGANLIQVVSVAGMFGVFFLGSLYMQAVLGYDAFQIGLAFLPLTVIMGLMSVKYSDKIILRFGAWNTVIPAIGLILAATLLFTQVPVDGEYWTDLMPIMLLLGTGAGLAFPSLMNLAMSSATPQDAGLASGLVNTTAQVGAALGLAVLATLSTSRTEELLADGRSQAAALVGGYELAYWVGAGLLAVGLLIAITVLKPVPPMDYGHAEVEADEFIPEAVG